MRRVRQRGFLPVGLLASPTLWLGIGCALLAFTTWASYNRWQAAVERESKVRGEYAGFVEQVGLRTAELEAENAKREDAWKAANLALKNRAAADRASLRAHLDGLREHPVDSSGREIPITTVTGPKPDDLPQRVVPIAALEQVRDELANDALTVTLLQDYITGVCLAR